jgi:hypothetical protein
MLNQLMSSMQSQNSPDGEQGRRSGDQCDHLANVISAEPEEAQLVTCKDIREELLQRRRC